jgi:hypothetical protein
MDLKAIVKDCTGVMWLSMGSSCMVCEYSDERFGLLGGWEFFDMLSDYLLKNNFVYLYSRLSLPKFDLYRQ